MRGFSLIETIIAMGLFVVIASSGIFSSLGALVLNRLGDENTQAGIIATEGLEAVRSIKKQSWSNLSDGIYGIGVSNNLWRFVGTTNTINQYTRTIGISTIDADTVRVDSTVTWNFAPSRNNTVSFTQYLTNWEKAISVPPPTTCSQLCQQQFSISGLCVKKNSCSGNSLGSVLDCGNADTCCCGSSPLPTPTPTQLPTPTPTTTAPTPTTAPTNCNQHCASKYGTSGTCSRSNQCNTSNEGRIYECNSPNICCCL
jgi:prepilin-type N-terminal cleavage/methylation domain-containing protein